MTRNEYEKKTLLLIDNAITKVSYHEIDYGDGHFHFFDDPRFDSVDFGLEFELDSGELIAITWGAEFCQYGISLIIDALSTVQASSRTRDVSSTSRWKPLLGKTIESADLFWSWFEESGKQETRVYYPQDLLLRFAGNSSIVISALEIRDGDWHMGMMDNITVFDNLEVAKEFKCLSEA